MDGLSEVGPKLIKTHFDSKVFVELKKYKSNDILHYIY